MLGDSGVGMCARFSMDWVRKVHNTISVAASTKHTCVNFRKKTGRCTVPCMRVHLKERETSSLCALCDSVASAFTL